MGVTVFRPRITPGVERPCSANSAAIPAKPAARYTMRESRARAPATPTTTASATASADVNDTTQKCMRGAASTGSSAGDEKNSQNSRNASSEPANGPSKA